MSELICRKTMMRCQTPGMCAPHGGCSTSAEAARAALAQRCAELEQCMSEPLNKLVRERDTLRAEVEQLQATVDRLESAYLAWQEKTDWVQRGISDGSLSAKYLGWHRADILKAEIGRLLSRGPRFTVIGKGGRYELLGHSSGAGCCRGEGRVIYRCLDTGQLYHRKDDDFAARMAPLTEDGEA